jgi:hypothetical protein
MQFRLRTLLIVFALGPPMLAGAWSYFSRSTAREVEIVRFFAGGDVRIVTRLPLP